MKEISENDKLFIWYFGSKRAVAKTVWERFGEVGNYIEPFFGGGSVYFKRPNFDSDYHLETINDMDGLVINAWRSIKYAPEEVWFHMDGIISETDLRAKQESIIPAIFNLQHQLESDPEFYDAKIAGWWCHGKPAVVGTNWCVPNKKGEPQKVKAQLGTLGRSQYSMGRRHKMPEILEAIQYRMKMTRVLCGDWKKVMKPSVYVYKMRGNDKVGFFLDPPYSDKADYSQVYKNNDFTVAEQVREWCKENGDNPRYRIALCGYSGEHEELEELGWSTHSWSSKTGFGNILQGASSTERTNYKRERVWFSPHCLEAKDE